MDNSNELAGIVQRILSGEPEAFDELYRHTYRAAFFHAKKVLKNEQDAEDAVAEGYLRAYENLSRLQNPEAVQSWICRIVTYTALNMVRDDRYRDTSSLDDEAFFYEPVAPESETPDLVLDKKGTEQLIGSMIDALPEVQRTAVMLYYYDEMSVAQIASVMGCSEGTVKSRLNYARKHLQEAILAEEKRGIKLYSVSPALLLTSIRRLISAEPISSEAYWHIAHVLADSSGYVLREGGKAALEAGVKKAAGKAAVKTAKAAATKGAAETIGAGAAKAGSHAVLGATAVKTVVSTKVIAIATAAVLTVGGTVTGAVVHNQQHLHSAEPTSAIVETAIPSAAPTESVSVVETSPMPTATPDPTPIPEPTPDLSGKYRDAYREVLAGYPSYIEYDQECNTYVLYDMDVDGIPELLVRSVSKEDPLSARLAIYRYDAGKGTAEKMFDENLGRRDHWYLAPYAAGPGVLVVYAHMGEESASAYYLMDVAVYSVEIYSRDARTVEYLPLEGFRVSDITDFSGLEWSGNQYDENGRIIDEDPLKVTEYQAPQDSSPAAETPTEIYRDLVRSLTDIAAYTPMPEDNYCTLVDLDGDGTEEMLIHYYSSKRSECYHRLAIYTIRDNTAVCLYEREFTSLNGTGWFALCSWDGKEYLASVSYDTDTWHNEDVELLDPKTLTVEHKISAATYPDLNDFSITLTRCTVDGTERSWDEYNEKIFCARRLSDSSAYTVYLLHSFIS